MSLKSLASEGLAFVLVLGAAAVVALSAEASHLSDPTRCSCSASLGFDKPSLQWSSNGLVFIPRVNFSIRARGGDEAPPLNVSVNYEGETAGTSFNGRKPIVSGWPCNGRYRSSGVELTRLLVPSAFGEGKVRMKATIEGCGFGEEHRQFSFEVREFGNLHIGGWRSVR